MSEGDIRTTDTATEEDPFRFGWRYIQEEQPDGSFETKVIPLPEEALLHPEEGDQPVHTDPHTYDVSYLYWILRKRTPDRPGYRLFADLRIDWQHPDIRPHGPDLVAFENVGNWDRTKGTFTVLDANARPLFVIEVTSPDTKKNDLGIKRAHYAEVGVPFYYIVDRCFGVDGNDARLLGYRLVNKQWESIPIGEDDRLPIEVLDLYLGLEEVEGVPQAVLYEADGHRLEIGGDNGQSKEEAQEQFEAEMLARQVAEREAREAERRAEVAEELARREIEARSRAEREAKKEAEARERAEREAKEEAEARERAEREAKEEAEARQQAEREKQDLERQLRELRAQFQHDEDSSES